MLEHLRKDVEMVQAALIAREAVLAEEKLELQKLGDELVAGGSRGGAAVDVDLRAEAEAIPEARKLELLRSSVRDATAEMGEGVSVLVELSKMQRSLKERATKKQRCGWGTAASLDNFGVVSWNVAGITASLLSSFLFNCRCARVCALAAVSCVLVFAAHVSPEQLRRLAVQLASLTSLEDVVTHGIQSLLESPSSLVAPTTAEERASSASLSRPRSRSRSSFGQGCPEPPRVDPAPPERSGSSRHRSDSLAPAPGLKESAGASRSARTTSLPTLRAAAADPRASAAQPARRSSSGAAEATSDGGAHAGMRSGPRGARFSFKLLPASLSGPAAMTPRRTMTITTPATLSCSFARTPSSRLCCLPAAGVPWTCSPSSSRATPSPIKEPVICDSVPRLGADLPGPSLEHGWTCARLGLVLLLIG